MRKRICIISFSIVAHDARVLRQVEYLSPHYDVTLIGHGNRPKLNLAFQYVSIPRFTKISKLLAFPWLVLGKVSSAVYEHWYWSRNRHQRGLQALIEARPDVIHANDWDTLPIAVEAANRTNAKVVTDLHEYAPLQFGNRLLRRIFFAPLIRHMLHKYASYTSAAITVCNPIAQRYKEEFGINAIIVRNIPSRVPVSEIEQHIDNKCIRLIHHGGALRDRGLEAMIEGVAEADERFTLDLMLLPDQPKYLEELRRLAAARDPKRIRFIDPVLPSEIAKRLSHYSIGLSIIQPKNYNYLMALPNKLFDYIGSGLAVLVGPSPAMAEIVHHYGVGVVTSSFEPSAIAQALNSLTVEKIIEMRRAARLAANELNADREMAKLVDLYGSLLGAEVSSVKQDKAQ